MLFASPMWLNCPSLILQNDWNEALVRRGTQAYSLPDFKKESNNLPPRLDSRTSANGAGLFS